MILFTADWHIKLGQKNVPVDWAVNRYHLFFDQIHLLEEQLDCHVIGGDLFDRLPTMEELELYFTFISEVTIPTISSTDTLTNKSINASNNTLTNIPNSALTNSAVTITAGDGLDKSGNTLSVDLKANGGLVIESTEIAIDLAASSITGTLPVSKLTSVTSTATELNVLDGITSTTTELNLMDGGTSATSTTLAAADRFVCNDAGTMKQVALSDLVTFLEDESASSFDIDGGTY